MRRLLPALVLLLGIAAAVLCLPGHAGWVEDRDGKTVIHVTMEGWILPDPSNPNTNNRADVEAVKLFRQRFPDIFAQRYRDKYKATPDKYGRHNWDNVEIELHKATGITVEGVESDLLAIAGGTAPDILYINFRKSDNYIQNRFVAPLDEYIESMTEEELDFRVNKKIWPVIKRKGPDGEKHVWAFPYGGALGKVLLFRRDLFDAKNIPYPDINWTWEKMLDACKKITDPKKETYGILLSRGKHESWYWCAFLWTAGGDVMDYNEDTDQWRCVFDSREAAVALDYYTRLGAERWVDAEGKVRRGYSTKDASETYAKWARGEVGMLYSYIDEKVFATIDPEQTGMVPVPLGPTGKRGGELNSRMMGMFSQVKDPVVRDAAWEYMRFYDCEEATKVKTKVMVEGGLGRFVNPKYLRVFGYPEIERLAPKGWSETFDIAIETGRPEPYGRNSNLAYDLMTFPIAEAENLAVNDKLPEDPDQRLNVLHGLLKKACARANEEMIGIITPRERLMRRVAAIVALLGIVFAFSLSYKGIIKAFTPPSSTIGDRKGAWSFRRYMWAYVLLIPAVLTVFLWSYVPVIRGSVMAFYDYRLIGKSTWVGVDNFGDLLFDGFWWKSVWYALYYSFLVVGLTFLPPVILAVALQEVPHGKLMFRIIYYLPAVIAGLVTVILWKQFYQPSEQGALNALIMNIPAWGFVGMGIALLLCCLAFTRRLWIHEKYPAGWVFVVAGVMLLMTCVSLAGNILFPPGESLGTTALKFAGRLFATTPEPYRWLSDSKTAMFSCVLPMVWAGVGPGCLIYLAALKGIPDEFYEAADIDGASFIDKILFVVFPTLKALIMINFIGVFIGSWYSGTQNILVLTGGGAKTEVVGLHIWYKAFTFLKFGPATAMAWMLGFMLIGFTVHQLRMLSRLEFRTTGQTTK
ncbi:MAG: hypothetical protein A3K19_04185 [Lentisphaerae bacterium RIFOXYB12_FULL_65_16]|nr:MAG: hypothetical protein A3K18_09515 [Lentisphaerae bacterium RIFOXYA12_64_32]OGV84283.1 MAG: hypothetical protein A3K19_04185 [Lentisphaerae bacterium RIFOXYB12_FULL_65_16]